MTKVSLITPTGNRARFLPLLEQCVIAQTYADVEWLILDDSPEPNAAFAARTKANIRYVHARERLTIGEKRNRLVEMATGDIILHFDDDDYYGPDYVATAIAALQSSSCDMAILDGFFVAHLDTDAIGYYLTQLKQGIAYNFSNGVVNVLQLEKIKIPLVHLCFGFSYAYGRKVWENAPFQSLNAFEDRSFTLEAMNRFKVMHYRDTDVNVIHTVHGNSTSNSFPQFMIPPFMLHKLNPHAFRHLEDLRQLVKPGPGPNPPS